MKEKLWQKYPALIIYSVGGLIILIIIFLLSLIFKPVKVTVVDIPAKDIKGTVINFGTGEKTFEPVELNGKVLSTKETYVVEKQKVLNEMKKIGLGTMDLKTLGDITDEWVKIVDKEKCRVSGAGLVLPRDYQIYLDRTITVLEAGCN